jgi:hypothetical protein
LQNFFIVGWALPTKITENPIHLFFPENRVTKFNEPWALVGRFREREIGSGK